MKKSLKKKLRLILVLAITLPVVFVAIFMYQQSLAKMNELVDDTLNNSVNTVNYFLDLQADKALTLAQKYAQNEEIKNALISGERDTLSSLADPIFERIKEDNQLTVFEYGDANGFVFYRAHNPEKFEDSKADNISIQAALSGLEVSGLEIGKSGLAVRAFVPLKDGDKIVGTFQVGFDDSILNDIKNAIHGDVALYNEDVLVKTSNEKEEEMVGKAPSDSGIYEKVLAGESVKVNDSEQNVKLYYPLYNTLGDAVIGMVCITQDMSYVNGFKSTSFITSFIIIVVTLLLSIIIAYILAKSITDPILKVVRLIQKTSELNLVYDSSYEELSHQQDEIGVIAQSVAQMNGALRNMVTKIMDTTTNLETNAQDMAVSAEESTKNNYQVVTAIEEIARGNTELSQNVTTVNESISALAKSIQVADSHTKESANNAKQSIQLVLEGQSAVSLTADSLKENVNCIEEVNVSVSQLIELIEKIRSITEVINGISSQTNLLALNASIEASHAGEAGKGFAVVAEEVRKLAEHSNTSANEISDIIKLTAQNSAIVAEDIQRTKETLETQKKAVYATQETFERIKESVEDIANRTNQASSMLEHVNCSSSDIAENIQNITMIAENTAENSAKMASFMEHHQNSVELTDQAALDISTMANKLSDEINKFQV